MLDLETLLDGAIFQILKVLAALLLVGLNGFFVTAEFAFTRLREANVEAMVEQGRSGAGMVKEATSRLDTYLAVCQVGITIASLGLGALGEPAVARLIGPLLAPFLPEASVHVVAFVVGFLVITFLHVTYGELLSKSVAIAAPEGSARVVAPPMKALYYVFFPIVKLTNGTANASARLFGIPPPSETTEQYPERELQMFVSQSREQGYLEEEEESRVRAAFELDERSAREIMVPRPEVTALAAGTGLEDLISVAADGNEVRYPVTEDGRAERIMGSVHVKDVVRAARDNGGPDAEVTAGQLSRAVLTVPENRRVDQVLDALQRQRKQMAVVVDEWGSFEGIITIENILEEIVGGIYDEFDPEPEPEFRERGDGSYELAGSIALREANEALGSRFESRDFDTLGGLVMGELGRVPEAGDEVSLGGYTLRVEQVDGPRAARITVRYSGPESRSPETG